MRLRIGGLVSLGTYGVVGAVSAGLHALVFLLLPRLGAPLPLANLTAFLLASFWSYGAHARLSFRHQTRGRAFPRRWLLLQLGLNVVLSVLLPCLFAPWASSWPGVVVLVFTPTAVNYGVWSLAARQVAWQFQRLVPAPVRHADDLGLHPAINRAIFDLADRGLLQSASLMVAGPAVDEAVVGLRRRPQLKICLHLVLSEGPALAPVDRIPLLLNRNGLLAIGFGRLLWASIWPFGQSKSFAQQLAIEVEAQLRSFVALTGSSSIHLDGHQHLHLLPVVWRILLRADPLLRPVWVRTVREPWPTGVSSAAWFRTLFSTAWLKWIVLSFLSQLVVPILRQQGIATNSGFAGVLFTGRMAGATLSASERHLRVYSASQHFVDPLLTLPMLLAHPAVPSRDALGESSQGGILIDGRYRHSAQFYASPWRFSEYEALAGLDPRPVVE